MCRDRHPEIFWKSGQIWQNLVSGRGEIWQFGFSQGPGGAGIHLAGSVLMSGPQKPNHFPIWAIWGSVRANFPIIWGFPLGGLGLDAAPGMQVQYCTALLLDPHDDLMATPIPQPDSQFGTSARRDDRCWHAGLC